MEYTRHLEAWHQEYCLWKAEYLTIIAFPCLLNEIHSTVPLVSPSCVPKPTLVPPVQIALPLLSLTHTKYSSAVAWLAWKEHGLGPPLRVALDPCALSPTKLAFVPHQLH
eukprot:7054066-Ditylum_brightwellii.AAC.1